MLFIRTLLGGHTNILVYGSEIRSGCIIIAEGANEDALLTIDFGQGPCTSGKGVTLSEGSIFVNGNEEQPGLGWGRGQLHG